MKPFKYWTRQQIADEFGLKLTRKCTDLDHWLSIPASLTEQECHVLEDLKGKLTRLSVKIKLPPIVFSIRNKINVHSRLVLFPLYFTKFSLKTVSIRVKFGSSKEKITTRRMYIYLIPDTKGQSA